MPTIRDGRGVLTVHDMGVPPPGSPSGPVERDRVSEQRMADFAAERAAAAPERHHLTVAEKATAAREHIAASRARGAKAGGFVAGATKPLQIKPTPNAEEEHVDSKRDQRRIERRERILAAIRSTSSYVGAAAAVGLSRSSIEVFVSDLRRRGELPGDVAELLSGRNPSIAKRTAAPAKPTIIEVQAPGAGVPATDATERGTTGLDPAPQGGTPPAPIFLDGISLQLTLDVSAAEIATWRPERIALFFRGVATVTMARWATEA